MFGTVYLISLAAAAAFLIGVALLRPIIEEKMQRPQRVPVPVRVDEGQERGSTPEQK